MNVSVEISLYPLTADYKPTIIAFIHALRAQPGIEVATNNLSTQLTGEYDTVMAALTEAMRPTMAGEASCSFVCKILNVGLAPGKEVEI